MSRNYRSELRAERTEETRERILDAVIRVILKEGIADLSIPLVAREARVAVPTVYRHFPTKRRLLTSIGDHAVRSNDKAAQRIAAAIRVIETLRKVSA